MGGSPRILSSACLMVLGLFAGCGPANPAAPSVSGVVTFDGEPLLEGHVALLGPGGAIASAEIQPDGTFLIDHAPLGPVRASIAQPTPRPPFLRPAGLDGGAAPSPRTFKHKPVVQARSAEVRRPRLPQRYADPERADLSMTVVPGAQSHDFHLGVHGPLASRPSGSKPDAGPALGVRLGQIAPNIEGEDFDGRPFSLRDYRGQVVVLTFWGHW